MGVRNGSEGTLDLADVPPAPHLLKYQSLSLSLERLQYLSIYLPIFLSICIYLSIYLSMYLSENGEREKLWLQSVIAGIACVGGLFGLLGVDLMSVVR